MENTAKKRPLSPPVKAAVLRMQKGELTEHYIYEKIARRTKDAGNRQVLERIAAEEKAHAEIWKTYTGEDVKPSKAKIFWYTMISRFFGFTFALKLMENGEDNAQVVYDRIAAEVLRPSRYPPMRRPMRPRCWTCWTRRSCGMWAPWCWASTMRWWN